MSEKSLITLLKVVIVLGLCLIGLGYYLINVAHIEQSMGISGMMIGGGCYALGLILSLPTKMYLTFIWVTAEQRKKSG
ncbi:MULTISPECIES: hypothetical protein [Pseudoalteromonas]|uniref:hypothetical protein n=1 Tax=Pseudoalteromonas TaxID=53246 RepID=UPI00026C9F55|nr:MULTISPECIES: hypothetical protein [Pseudoalteromonas]ATC97419.1 hypothetical protein PSPO_a0166 [Pseudoalteromonas spongiae UST010723-006]KPV94908.1 hypothetical protein AN214_03084 [Pseudoalteromonas sp. P1-9]TMO82104.1 hypothetical protein CWC15_20185 [Pseudoalteromonas spongiae]